MNTDIDLVAELEKRNIVGEGANGPEGRYDKLIKNAKAGMYHDFKSMGATPKMTLIHHLKEFEELSDLREAVINGQYDEPWPDKK